MGRSKRLIRGEFECAYCGKVPAETIDHVIPRGLFSAPLPSDMITVPACSTCNSAKSKPDSFLRDYLVCNVDAPPNQTADAIRVGPYQRAVDRKQSEFGKELVTDRFHKLKLSDENGAYLGMLVNMPFGKGPIKESIIFIVKGLYYRMLKKRIPVDHTFLVGGIPTRELLLSHYQVLRNLGHTGSAKIGDNKVFACFCGSYRSDKEAVVATMWGLIFYDRTYIGCTSLSPSSMRKINPALLAQF
jgi:hypothetical protein